MQTSLGSPIVEGDFNSSVVLLHQECLEEIGGEKKKKKHISRHYPVASTLAVLGGHKESL